ncbi:PE domain-containing protein [Lentzea tibetensis]|uniref:PE domain-containing protein n=1 Tax=Lentzea tibetensis TaxID=2591470 RepID=A0A563EZW0_9PSEU|nr:PE domain-containing protein [Lentzea tibetensis]TWP53082.1 PE domain-containing protein [Lentzea tibetensis]
MFIADGGGSGQALPPDYSGQKKLKVDPSAIPQAKAAFQHALDELDKEMSDAGPALMARPWADDPVSGETAKQFNVETHDKALMALTGYRAQLAGVVDQLKAIEEQYRMTEGDNEALWGKHHR